MTLHGCDEMLVAKGQLIWNLRIVCGNLSWKLTSVTKLTYLVQEIVDSDFSRKPDWPPPCHMTMIRFLQWWRSSEWALLYDPLSRSLESPNYE